MRTETEILAEIHAADREIDLAKAKRKTLSEEFDQAVQRRLAKPFTDLVKNSGTKKSPQLSGNFGKLGAWLRE
jgi:hypothetical protein